MGSYPSENGFDYTCPNCGCKEIHTWLIAICYGCGHEARRSEFAANEKTKKWEKHFEHKYFDKIDFSKELDRVDVVIKRMANGHKMP